jgi:hypothetical protein
VTQPNEIPALKGDSMDLHSEAVIKKWFPLQDGPMIPWGVIAPHEGQAQRNHGQSLQRLAERGGLGVGEFWYVMNDIDLRAISYKDAEVKGKELAQSIVSQQGEIDRLRALCVSQSEELLRIRKAAEEFLKLRFAQTAESNYAATKLREAIAPNRAALERP